MTTLACARTRTLAAAAALALAVALMPAAGAGAATGSPLASTTPNFCEDGRAVSKEPTPPAGRPVANLVLRNGSSKSDPPIANNAVLTAPKIVLHDGSASSGSQPLRYCAWHGDVASKYHFQPATETHVYQTPGFYRPWMFVVDNADVWSAERAYGPTFQINEPPKASFKFSPAGPTPGDRVTFTSDSTDFEQDKYKEAVSYEWDLDGKNGFDDGSGATASYTYPSAKLWTAKLQVTDSNGAKATATADVPVGARAGTSSGASSTPQRAAIPNTRTGTQSGLVKAVNAQGEPQIFLAPRVVTKFRVRRSRTRIRMLALRSLVEGSTVFVRCRGRGCPRRSQSVVVTANSVRLRRFERSLRTGAVLEVKVTLPGTIGRYLKMRMRRGKSPTRRELCVPDGATKPGAC